MFKQEANKIKSKLSNDCVALYHVGSTSVPGFAAKPKIDIIAEVKNLIFNHQGLADLKYEYRGGFSLPLRKSFTYRSTDLNVNLHIFEKDDPSELYLEINSRYPSLTTHKFSSLRNENDEEIFEAYVQKKTPVAYEFFGTMVQMKKRL